MDRTKARKAIGSAGIAIALLFPTVALADEDGVSFWLPGLFGSLAAVPQAAPGWSFLTFSYDTDVSAGADVARARSIRIGRFDPTVGASLSADLDANVALQWIQPNYAFATPVLGGQATVGLGGYFGHNDTDLDGTVTATVGPIVAERKFNVDSSLTGFGDLYPIGMLKWHDGVNNYMVYATGDIPVGAYDPKRLANLGIGHGAIDGGVGYTYLNPENGYEFSIVSGLTGNFENTDTDYTSGIDWHTDWGASKFLSKQLFVGLVGYVYDQISPDSGSGDRVGAFESRVIGVGPQLGYLFPVGEHTQGYMNLKGYKEFDEAHRPGGVNIWLTFAFSPAAPETTSARD
jgi:hypothetical protein